MRARLSWCKLQVDIPAEYLSMSTPACPTMTRDWAFCRYAIDKKRIMAIPPTTFYGPKYQVRCAALHGPSRMFAVS